HEPAAHSLRHEVDLLAASFGRSARPRASGAAPFFPGRAMTKARLVLASSAAVVASAAVACAPRALSPRVVRGTPVVTVSAATLRAAPLPAYGSSAVATPHLDALRRDSIQFDNAYTHCPLTLPAHLSLLTGLLPAEHAVRNNLGYRFDGAAH